MPLVLALDQSTSATKALLFDEAGRCLDRESRQHHQHYPQPGWVEHDAEEIWTHTLSTLRALLARHSDRQQDIACLSLTNQRETIVVFERATGRPLHRAIVWQCRRSDALCSAQIAAGHEALIHSRTGLKIDAYFSASKIQWLVRQYPDLRDKLVHGEAIIGTIDTYLIYRLTACRVFATDSTNASRTLLFNLTRLSWDEELCSLWETPLHALPEVRDSFAHFGETQLDGTLTHPLPIHGVMGDSQASLFAQRCYDPGSAKITFGTGSSILLNIGSRLRLADAGVVTTLAWVRQGVPTYAFEGIIISSAATLSWLRDQLGFVRDTSEFELLACAIPDNGGVYLVPAFSGLGLPHWQPSARAALSGLSSQSDRRHVARAALESIAYQVRDALDALRASAELPLASLHCDGGAIASRFLMQFTADLTGTELRVATMSDCSPLGAAMAGLLSVGVHRSMDDLVSLPREELVYTPSMSAERSRKLYAGWQSAVRHVVET